MWNSYILVLNVFISERKRFKKCSLPTCNFNDSEIVTLAVSRDIFLWLTLGIGKRVLKHAVCKLAFVDMCIFRKYNRIDFDEKHIFPYMD